MVLRPPLRFGPRATVPAMPEFRVEHDSMGEVRVPADARWAAQTQRAVENLAGALRRKQRAFKSVVKSGRTHLMDATPVTLGQEFGGYAAAVEHGVDRLRGCLSRLGELPLGGTAVGTGINAPKTFAKS